MQEKKKFEDPNVLFDFPCVLTANFGSLFLKYYLSHSIIAIKS